MTGLFNIVEKDGCITNHPDLTFYKVFTMKTLKLAAIVLAMLPLVQVAHSATVTNGDFSAGTSGWATQGNVSTTSGYAVLTSAGSVVNTGAFGGTNGSMLSQAVSVKAGQTVSFDFNFSAGDYLPFNDFSLVVGDGSHLISDVAAVGDFGSSGWHTYSFVSTANFNSLMFLLSNRLDSSFDSTLFIDNVKIASTPIPAAVWLFGSSFVGLMGARRKKMMGTPVAA